MGSNRGLNVFKLPAPHAKKVLFEMNFRKNPDYQNALVQPFGDTVTYLAKSPSNAWLPQPDEIRHRNSEREYLASYL